MVVTDLRYWLLVRIIDFIVSVPMTLASPAGMNLPRPSVSILLLDWSKNSRMRAALPAWHLIPSTSVSIRGLFPIPMVVWNSSKPGQCTVTSSPVSCIAVTWSWRDLSNFAAISGSIIVELRFS